MHKLFIQMLTFVWLVFNTRSLCGGLPYQVKYLRRLRIATDKQCLPAIYETFSSSSYMYFHFVRHTSNSYTKALRIQLLKQKVIRQ